MFRIVLVPDTQRETANRPEVFSDRMRWIADNADDLRIRHVIQVGDLVDSDNCGIGSFVLVDADPARPQCNEAMRAANVFYPLTHRADHYQYGNASQGLNILDRAGLSYSLAVGNHDTAAVCGGPACAWGPQSNPDWAVPAGTTTSQLLRDTTTWDATFPQSRFPAGQFFEPSSTANMYQTFSAGGLNWLVLSLELWPRPEVVAWASQVAADHPEHNVIVNTHHFLSRKATIPADHGGYGSTSPKYLFDNLVAVHPNIRFVFSGHVNGPAHRADTGLNGNPIHSILNCYHDQHNAQTTVITIDPAKDRAQAITYKNPGKQDVVPAATLDLKDMAWVR